MLIFHQVSIFSIYSTYFDLFLFICISLSISLFPAKDEEEDCLFYPHMHLSLSISIYPYPYMHTSIHNSIHNSISIPQSRNLCEGSTGRNGGIMHPSYECGFEIRTAEKMKDFISKYASSSSSCELIADSKIGGAILLDADLPPGIYLFYLLYLF